MHFNCCAIFIFVQFMSSCFGYYWRYYHGKIPEDAIEAGTDVNNENVYIGQVFIKSKAPGIYPTSIHSKKDVFAPIYGAKKADNFIQILCGQDPENVHWIPTNATHLHLLNTEYQLIRGGVEDNKWLNIGRVNYQGGVSVGKVLSGHIGNADLWFAHNGNEVKSKTYEILTYNDVSSKIEEFDILVYYWRDYHGKIPEDAIEAGTDVNNENVYIGQVFIKSKNPGIYPTSIHYKKDVFAPIFGPKKADTFIQILCGQDPENLHWIPTNATDAHLLNTENQLIRGGVEDDKLLNIGRVNYQGGVSVGKVLSGDIGNANLWFVHNGNEVKSKTYEILTYNNSVAKDFILQ